MLMQNLTLGPRSLLLLACALLYSPTLLGAQQPVPRAATGDTVLVLLNHVKPDQRANFERYVFEILFPAIDKLAASDDTKRRQYVQTRVLTPTGANPDSTYTYVYIMDPLVPVVSYGYRDILSRVYTEQQVTEYLQLVNNALARPQVGYRVVQRH
jgi:hypothetical protein